MSIGLNFIRAVQCNSGADFINDNFDAEVGAVWDAAGAADLPYHGITHIAALLELYKSGCVGKAKLVEPLQPRKDDPDSIILMAILTHDWDYDVARLATKGRNEQTAAALIGTLPLPETTITKLQDIALATISHVPTKCPLTNYFLDMDLAVGLAGDYQTFKYASLAIREEALKVVSPEEYEANRQKFLRGMLNREHIFITDSFRKSAEQVARFNIRSSLPWSIDTTDSV